MMNRGVPHTQELGIQIPLLYLLEAPIYHEQLYTLDIIAVLNGTMTSVLYLSRRQERFRDNKN